MDGRMGGSAIGSKNVQGVVDKTDNAKCAPHIHSLKTELGKKRRLTSVLSVKRILTKVVSVIFVNLIYLSEYSNYRSS